MKRRESLQDKNTPTAKKLALLVKKIETLSFEIMRKKKKLMDSALTEPLSMVAHKIPGERVPR